MGVPQGCDKRCKHYWCVSSLSLQKAIFEQFSPNTSVIYPINLYNVQKNRKLKRSPESLAGFKGTIRRERERERKGSEREMEGEKVKYCNIMRTLMSPSSSCFILGTPLVICSCVKIAWFRDIQASKDAYIPSRTDCFTGCARSVVQGLTPFWLP